MVVAGEGNLHFAGCHGDGEHLKRGDRRSRQGAAGDKVEAGPVEGTVDLACDQPSAVQWLPQMRAVIAHGDDPRCRLHDQYVDGADGADQPFCRSQLGLGGDRHVQDAESRCSL